MNRMVDGILCGLLFVTPFWAAAAVVVWLTTR